MTRRQEALIQLIQSLDPDHRHTLEIDCRGKEPWTVTRIKEHVTIRLDPKQT